MEEKEVKETQKSQELSYEQLKNVAVQLQHKCVELENRLKSIDLATLKLGYLLKVLEIKDFPQEFMDFCKKEVMEMLTPLAEEEKEETKE